MIPFTLTELLLAHAIISMVTFIFYISFALMFADGNIDVPAPILAIACAIPLANVMILIYSLFGFVGAVWFLAKKYLNL